MAKGGYKAGTGDVKLQSTTKKSQSKTPATATGRHVRSDSKVGAIQDKKTSKEAASAASSVLKDKRTSKKSKTAAASALSQAGPKRKK